MRTRRAFTEKMISHDASGIFDLLKNEKEVRKLSGELSNENGRKANERAR